VLYRRGTLCVHTIQQENMRTNRSLPDGTQLFFGAHTGELGVRTHLPSEDRLSLAAPQPTS
jgi:hypothetical protein